MSPEEHQLLNGLFERTQASANAPRDPEAEAVVADAVKSQPHAPYYLAQAVLVQDQALQAANQRLNELRAQIESLQQQHPQPQSGGFLSGLGSIFGGAASPQQQPEPPRPAQPLPGGPWGQSQQPHAYPPQQGSPQQGSPQQGSPWGAPPPASGAPGFLSGALQSAAGVAGGVLLADSIRGLFGGHGGLGGLGGIGMSGLGTGGGFGGLGNGLGGSETIVNNYYEDNSNVPTDASVFDDGGNGTDSSGIFDDSNSSSGDFSSNDDGTFDV